ncbi:rRNA maturation RNase YbeY [Aestuariivita sp.]|jgi:probable rRNA maturation factor|uniref:rRNA maturation RNase YbeY n=1 Tax=Aestuariivita sp. TaxID=1872407 RepID=UPI00216FF032|nr:rRNA maturation RNase YbeY [Aestuariivita sp.]MCE8007549.1 rRNA maturation RNase YbeY [Aestuariivita sp.]
MPLEIIVEDDRWSGLPLEPLARRAVLATLEHLGVAADCAEVALLACDDTRIALLNTEFRDKPVPTNVLSWPSEERGAPSDGARPRPPQPAQTGEIALGDIAISWDTCAAEAREAGKSMPDHVTHLVVHGLLHLLGYDHLRDRDATLMEETEAQILGSLGINDPYKDY